MYACAVSPFTDLWWPLQIKDLNQEKIHCSDCNLIISKSYYFVIKGYDHKATVEKAVSAFCCFILLIVISYRRKVMFLSVWHHKNTMEN